MTRPARHIAALAALATTAGLLAAGCGGGSGDGTTSKAEVVAEVETACAKLGGYTIWLPEHLAKTGMSSDEGEALVDDAVSDFRSTLESLDPPADLRAPIEALAEPSGSPKSRAELRAEEEHLESLYEQVGANRCAAGVRASILSLDGASVEAAYERVGLPLPPHPDGW